MTRELNFKPLTDEQTEEEMEKARSRRWRRREANTTVQMSVRMPEETYERFRALCERERRTNGDMLRVLMEGYFERK